MSYILDALRRADAQREGDSARGIHAQPLHVFMPERGLRGLHRSWVWAGAAAILLAMTGAGWYFYPDAAAVSAVPARDLAPIAATAALPVPASRAPGHAVAAAPIASAVLPAPAAALNERTEPAGVAARPRIGESKNGAVPAMRGGTHLSTVAANAAASPASGASAPAATAPIAGVGRPASAPAPVAVASLPPDAPKLAISGGVYSTNKTQRMLIVNGQVFREGADLGSGLVLDEIQAKSAVFSFRGARYVVGY
jgi:general secretion pathway protein B